ncbi:MAG: exo-beta-N-acetylmuramidase NamZ family protein [Rubripirellula sp.]
MTRLFRAVIIFSAIICLTIDRSHGQVLAGIDVLVRDNFAALNGARVGLITNQTGTDYRGKSTVEHFRNGTNFELVALFSPEHGFAGTLDQAAIGDSQDEATGLKIYSLYGETRVPTKEMLDGIDTLVFDIQDIGTRFYTYISTMGGAMRAAAEHHIQFVVLDRPNPINGVTVQGPVLDGGSESFVGYHTLPVRHGMTVGELARMFRSDWSLNVDMTVITIEGWDRESMFDASGRLWINPSPNMRSLTQAVLYPGIGLLETTNLSVGRGTDTPFEIVGAPWIDAVDFAAALNSRSLPGVAFVARQFTPDASKYKDELCGGVNILVTDRSNFDPLRTGLAVAVVLHELYPVDWDTRSLNRLLSNQRCFEGILAGRTVDELTSDYQQDLKAFLDRRQEMLLYQ